MEGLSPEAVSVLDMNGNLLNRPASAGARTVPEPSEAALDYRQKVEHDLLAKINATLEPLLGADKFRAGVSVDCDFSGGEQSEEIFDPAQVGDGQLAADRRHQRRERGRRACRAPPPPCRGPPRGPAYRQQPA